jgi:nucleoside-diphosphate-sugar epimerase
MSVIYVLGKNSFLAQSLYTQINTIYKNIIFLSHTDINILSNVDNSDIIINFCGVNRASSFNEYNQANYHFIKNIVNILNNKRPYFIHVSSLMVYGFENKNIDDLFEYQKWFIESKLCGENYLKDIYVNDKLCIIRPANIFGYNCRPYYNNLLITLLYEKINNLSKINKINKNCYRNILSINKFCTEFINILINKKYGIFNILSNNNINLEGLIKLIHNNIPIYIDIYNGELDKFNMINNNINGINIIVNENIKEELIILEQNMKTYGNI